MKKKIYHAKIKYNWRVVRYVKGVRKASKNWKISSVDSCVTDIKPEDLNNNKYFIRGLEIKHKSTNEIEIKVLSVLNYKYLCMSNDIY